MNADAADALAFGEVRNLVVHLMSIAFQCKQHVHLQ
jgi:hypothetical protein